MRKQLGTLALSLVLGLGFIGASAPAVLASSPNEWTLTCTKAGGGACWVQIPHTFVDGDHMYYTATIVTTGTGGGNVGTSLVYSNGSGLTLNSCWNTSGYGSPGSGTQTSANCAFTGTISPWLRSFTNTLTGGSYTFTYQVVLTSGPSYTPSFNGPCANGFAYAQYDHPTLGLGQSGSYKGVQGTAYVRPLHPCTLSPGDVNGYAGFDSVLPANLQQAVGTRNIVQLGYAQADCNVADPPCLFDNTVDDDVPHFIFTPNDNADGVVIKFNAFQSGTPTIGHQYKFTISPTKIGPQNYWNYCISDLMLGTSGCDQRIQTWSAGSFAWWGYEVLRTTDALGVFYGETPILMSNMQYRGNSSSSWMQKTGACGVLQHSVPYYGCDTTTTTIANDTISGFTLGH